MSERGEPSLRRIVVVAGLATLIQILNVRCSAFARG